MPFSCTDTPAASTTLFHSESSMQSHTQRSYHFPSVSHLQEESIAVPLHFDGNSSPVVPDPLPPGPSRTMEPPPQAEQFICRTGTCANHPRVYKRPGELREHTKMHTKPYVCDVCGEFRSKQKKDVARHKKSRHSTEASLPCEVPGCIYRRHGRHDNYLRHLREIHDIRHASDSEPRDS